MASRIYGTTHGWCFIQYVVITYYIYIILHVGAMATTAYLYYIDYKLPVRLFDLQCYGNESTIWNCGYDIADGQCYNDASVFCMCMFNL